MQCPVCKAKTALGLEKETHEVQTIKCNMNISPLTTPHKFPQNYTRKECKATVRQTELIMKPKEVHRL